MANVGTAAAGKTLIATGLTSQSAFASIGTSSGLTANGVVLSQGLGAFQATSSGSLGQVLTSNGAGSNPSFKTAVDLHTARFIVGNTSNGANYSTIASAITAASSGDTIFIQTGTYTENLTLKAGVNLTAFGSDSSLNGSGTVIISGTCTFTGTGTVTISGIQLQTNSAALLVVSGTLASVVNLNNCYLNCTNNTGITYSSSNAASLININYCSGNLGTTGIAFHSMTSPGTLSYRYCLLGNTGNSTTAASNSDGAVFLIYSISINSFSTSSTGTFLANYSTINVASLNIAAITTAGSSSGNAANQSTLASGSASSVSVGSGTTMNLQSSIISSSNTNAITGSGSLIYSGLIFPSSAKINTTTQTGGLLPGGLTQAPSAGYIGQQISNSAANVATTSTVAKTITSISITAGIWDVSTLSGALATGGTVLLSDHISEISTTDNTLTGSFGLNQGEIRISTGATVLSVAVPSFRVTLTATTIYYLVVQNTYTSTTCPTWGSIRATRVG